MELDLLRRTILISIAAKIQTLITLSRGMPNALGSIATQSERKEANKTNFKSVICQFGFLVQ